MIARVAFGAGCHTCSRARPMTRHMWRLYLYGDLMMRQRWRDDDTELFPTRGIDPTGWSGPFALAFGPVFFYSHTRSRRYGPRDRDVYPVSRCHGCGRRAAGLTCSRHYLQISVPGSAYGTTPDPSLRLVLTQRRGDGRSMPRAQHMIWSTVGSAGGKCWLVVKKRHRPKGAADEVSSCL